ncbi:unnamed protein product, partial [Gongylonema pulchrum]|uniref:Chromo domain-containing protein n=1 Tax=Gongylonema pulchrum TaxID=637853 RepID=A0A183EI47_9BILA
MAEYDEVCAIAAESASESSASESASSTIRDAPKRMQQETVHEALPAKRRKQQIPSMSKEIEEQRRSADRLGLVAPPPPPTRNDDALIDGLIVDKLIGRRSHDGHTQYLVCWYGVPEEDAAWDASLNERDALGEMQQETAREASPAKR